MIVAEITAAIMAIFVILLIIVFPHFAFWPTQKSDPAGMNESANGGPQIRTAPSTLRQGRVKGVLMFREALGAGAGLGNYSSARGAGARPADTIKTA